MKITKPTTPAVSTPAPTGAAKPAAPTNTTEAPSGGWSKTGAAKGTPTVQTPSAPASKPVADAVATLKKAMDGIGTDEKKLLATLEGQAPALIASIAKEYEAQTGTSLRKALNSELSGADLRRGLAALDGALVKPGSAPGTGGVADKINVLRNQGTVSESELVNTYKPTTNNKIELMIQGDTAFPKLMESIDKAKDSINMSYYIFNDDKLGNEMADKLIAAKQRGVEVRVMLDGIGSQLMNPMSGSNKILKRLEAAGIETRSNHLVDVTRDSQIMNHPDHRKIVVVDGKTGFTGGMNVGEHYLNQYHDVMVKAEGDVVKQMQSEWMSAWMHLGGKIPGDDATVKARFFPEYKPGEAPGNQKITTVQHIPGENRAILQTYLDKINTATKSIHIENPYCTNPDIQNALIAAAGRGVDVRVVLPGESDHGFSHMAARQKYPEMIKAGVHIYEYPGFNHDKVMVTDSKFVTTGSSNLDDVALYHVYEMNLNVEDEKFAKDTIDRLFTPDIAKSKEMRAEEISKLQIMTGKFWNLFSHFI
ncbi:MAG: phospholipase D-like domain-containing protein [Archangium sp.]